MKTAELIAALARDVEPVDSGAGRRRLGLAAAGGIAGSLPLLVLLLGINPALAQAATLPMFWIKFAFVAAIAAAGLWTVAGLARPGVTLARPLLALSLPVVAMTLLAGVVLFTSPPSARAALVMGSSWSACPWRIALLSLPALVLVLAAVRSLAPTRLRLAGAACGLLAGACGALVYLLYCPELAPPFLAIWYVLGMLVPAVLGALVGPRVLRW